MKCVYGSLSLLVTILFSIVFEHQIEARSIISPQTHDKRSFKSERAKDFFVNGKSIPLIDFDLGDRSVSLDRVIRLLKHYTPSIFVTDVRLT